MLIERCKPLACQQKYISNETIWCSLQEVDVYYTRELLFFLSTAMKVALHIICECILYARFYGKCCELVNLGHINHRVLFV